MNHNPAQPIPVAHPTQCNTLTQTIAMPCHAMPCLSLTSQRPPKKSPCFIFDQSPYSLCQSNSNLLHESDQNRNRSQDLQHQQIGQNPQTPLRSRKPRHRLIIRRTGRGEHEPRAVRPPFRLRCASTACRSGLRRGSDQKSSGIIGCWNRRGVGVECN